MEMCSNFDAYELRRLARRFKKLDLDGSGSLSVDEFMSLPELQQNPLVQRVIDIFDEDGNGEVDFRGWTFKVKHLMLNIFLEFIQGISQFSVKGDKNIKLKCKLIKAIYICDLFIYFSRFSNLRYGQRWLYFQWGTLSS